jgi:hypothetical protein
VERLNLHEYNGDFTGKLQLVIPQSYDFCIGQVTNRGVVIGWQGDLLHGECALYLPHRLWHLNHM